MKTYAVKFKYDDGYENSNQVCIVFAENETQAMVVFQENIYVIFNGNDDLCNVDTITEVQNPELIFMQRGTMWSVRNNKNKVKTIW